MNPHQSGAAHWTQRTPERVRRGTNSHAAVLSAAQIAEICERTRAGCRNRSWLARRFGVSRITIWRHLKAHGLIKGV